MSQKIIIFVDMDVCNAHQSPEDAGQQVAEARRITWVGFWVNAFLGVIKVVGGILGRSSALVADGIHSFSDFLSDIIVIVMVGVARRAPDGSHQFGHGKYETLATLLLGLMLVIVAIGIFADGVSQVVEVAHGKILPKPLPIALVILIISIVSKEWLYWATLRVGKRIHSQAVITNAWHHRTDSFSSIATLVGVGGSMLLGEQWRVLDPVAAMIVAIFIVTVGIKAIGPSLSELLGSSLSEELQIKIREAIVDTEGVIQYHDLRTSRSGQDCIIEVHVKVDPKLTVGQGEKIADKIEENIRCVILPSNAITNIHIEPYHPEKS